MTLLIYIVTVKQRYHISLLALLLLLVSAASADTTLSVEGLSTQSATISNSDFCGSTPPAAILCPKTSARLCLCSMGGKSPEVQHELSLAQETITRIRIVKIKPKARVLPQAAPTVSLLNFVALIPTPPPRF